MGFRPQNTGFRPVKKKNSKENLKIVITVLKLCVYLRAGSVYYLQSKSAIFLYIKN